ncbi:RagB/SusD family nutrient uptake outer membrane protein [Chitinophagaceae bacterium LB-8]|uniref:RagB/SusD family nutrient uptake outer membrane protein n=1 Tax=Paraflavisolibacter caeni TaxID=2982496 RepID=A0A9X2XW97_9BACT|nr:RagB/SusD family nutrient uptake outer membrane protein [Paraflavisolibacter caeni]MCU7549807.1 RagB/SusD family nutrient uptake outer membrane protein [Paraflavisolibacter caeni]
MMKRIYIPLLLFAGMVWAGMMTGCSKDFLEKPKGGAVTVDTIFHTQMQAQYAVADMYKWCVPSGFVLTESADCREDALTDNVHLTLPGAAWVAANYNYQYYIFGNMTPSAAIDRGPTSASRADAPPFTGWYKAIRKANLVLKNIDNVSDATPGWITDVKGQAIFCRAMAHYSAFRLYGGVPIVTSVLSGDGQISIPRASVQSVVDSIVSWCDQAAALLPTTRAGVDYGKVTSLAALALKARILLYAASPLYNTPSDMKSMVAGARFGDARDSVLCYPTYDKQRWKRAADAAKAVIDAAPASGVKLWVSSTPKPATNANTDTYAGLGDYEAVCNNVYTSEDGKTFGLYGNPEMILVNTFNQKDPDRSQWNQWGFYNTSKIRMNGWGAKNNVPVEFLQLYEKKNGTKWTATPSGLDFKDYFLKLDLDPRAYQSLAFAGQWFNNSRTFAAYYKAATDGSYSKGAIVDDTNAGDATGSAVESVKFVARVDNMNDNHFVWPVFRLAEFYLSYAEALNEYSGPAGEPTTYLNLIRARAGMPAKSPASTDAFREDIQNERTVELAFEMHRYNDLHRWLKAHTVLSQTFHGFAVTASKNGVNPKPTNPFLNWELISYGTRSFPVKYYYVPFPYNQISMNYLGGKDWDGQNPGW